MTRVLAHAHSTWSHDGCIALTSYVEVARGIGCSAVLLTEHEESGWDDARYEAYVAACDAISAESAVLAEANRVRLVPGIEFNQNGYHGLGRLPRRPSTLAELSTDVHRQGCVLALAHPGKYHWRVPSALIAGVDAIEIWNSKWIYDGAAGPHPRSIQLAGRRRKQVIAGQDVHKPKHLSPLILMTRGGGDHIIDDIASERYECAWGTRVWSLEALREMNTRSAAEGADWHPLRGHGIHARAHRIFMDVALAGYHAAGQVLHAKAKAEKSPPRVHARLSSTPALTMASMASATLTTSMPSMSSMHSAPSIHATPMPLPSVSVVLPIRNEAAFIGRALASVLTQDYPVDRLEVLVADGRSTDATRDIVSFFEARSSGRVRLIDNPGEIVPTGLNAAIAEASGDVIVRVDGHCEVPPDFVRRAVLHLSRDAVDCVGGILDTVGETRTARVIAAAMSAPFGVGGSAFRSTDTTSSHAQTYSTLTDTVAFPAFTRDAIARAGWFDEELVRNQDDEYSYRLRRLGGRILLAADMRARYYSRGTMRGLWRQCFEYGYWKVRVLQKHPRQMRARQFVPAMFVAGLAAGADLVAIAPWLWPLPASVIALYIAAAAAASASTAYRHGWWRHLSEWRLIPHLTACFVTMHVAYGLGSLTGAVGFWRRWGSVGREPAPRRGVA
jgi:succinoglycan biosynthesis protein ExoA